MANIMAIQLSKTDPRPSWRELKILAKKAWIKEQKKTAR